MKKQENVIKGFKGFDKDLKCRDFQYKEGKEYETDQKPVRCTSTGFHFCEDALDVFSYYPPLTSKFHEATGSGDVDRAKGEDSKIAVSKIKIGAEISLFQMIKLGVECVLKRVKATTGYYAHSATTGYYAHSATTGNYAHSATTGNSAHSATTGKDSISCGLGVNNIAKASIGSWIVLAEYKDDSREIRWVKSAKIDGKKLLPDTFYSLENGKFVKSDEQ
jgi:hypothetical protein